MERVYTTQPFINGANFAAGYPVNISILKGKGLNLGTIKRIGLGYYFKAEGTSLTELNPKADQFYVTIPTKYDGVVMGKWYLYDWNAKVFAEATPGVSATSGAKTVAVSGAFINSDSDIVLIAAPEAPDLGKLPFPDLDSLLDKDVTASGKHDHICGDVTVTITNSGLIDGEDVAFYFVRGKNDFVAATKAVKEVRPGVFVAVFSSDELKGLKDGVRYAVQYTNAGGTASGFSTFNNGSFIYFDILDNAGCDAGLGLSVMGLFIVLLLAKKKNK
jgi:hypothetical protein